MTNTDQRHWEPGRASASGSVILAWNPSQGLRLGSAPATPGCAFPGLLETARGAQAHWAGRPWSQRRAALKRIYQRLAGESEHWAARLMREIGKPANEAWSEIITTLDLAYWTLQYGGKVLAPQSLGPGRQRWLLMPRGRLEWTPHGVVGMWGTWNYPLFLNFPAVFQALAAGNAVILKWSESCPLLGVAFQELWTHPDLPDGLVTVVQGGREAGEALSAVGVDYGFYTGGTEGGRAVMKQLAERGIPMISELSGCDAAVILPDAKIPSTAPALVWSAFSNMGQTCVGVKRIYVAGNADPWISALKQATESLRIGDPTLGNADLGPMIRAEARADVHARVTRAVDAGAELVCGGVMPTGPGWFYPPTLLKVPRSARHDVDNVLTGIFGPVVWISETSGIDETVDAVNSNRFGLSASVWGCDKAALNDVARRLTAGSVGLNEAVTFSAHASAPFGGRKDSGSGRVHGDAGLRSFAQSRVVFRKRLPIRIRPQLFPYNPTLAKLLAAYRRWFHRAPKSAQSQPQSQSQSTDTT